MNYIIEQASSFASGIDNLFLFITVVTVFWLLVAEGVFVYFLIKYRSSKSKKAEYITGDAGENLKAKKIANLMDFAIIGFDMVIIVWAISLWVSIKQDTPQAEEIVRVEGYQWIWVFTHSGPDGLLDTADDIKTVDELHVKNNVVYHYELTAHDVLHNFSVPVFRLKQDSIPGRVIKGWFKPIKTGEFDVQCAEICGIGHGAMAAKIYVQTEEDYNAWMNENSAILAQGSSDVDKQVALLTSK